MINLAILSLLVLVGCVHDVPVAAPVAAPTAAAPSSAAKEAPTPANRAIQIVTLANKDVQCADLRRPGDVADTAVCLMPGGAFVWLSASPTRLDVVPVADSPKKPEEKPASSPDAPSKPAPSKPAAKGKP